MKAQLHMEANTKAEGESRLQMPRVPNSGNMVGASVDRNVPLGNRYGPDGCTHRRNQRSNDTDNRKGSQGS